MNDKFNNVYKNQIEPLLNDLETQRSKTANNVLIVVIMGIIIGFIFAGLSNHIFVLIIAIVFIVLISSIMTSSYKKQYKEKIMPIVLSTFEGNLKYQYDNFIKKDIVYNSYLFERGNRYKGEDYVSGTIGTTNFKFSEILIQQHTSNGKTSSTRTIFDGSYYIFDFNKHFKFKTQVRSNGRPHTGLFSGIDYDKTELEDVDFNNRFKVYTEDEVECRYLLTPHFMEKIKRLERLFNNSDIYLSFINSQIHVAQKSTKNLFEPRIFNTIDIKQEIYEHYKSFETIFDIVKELDLNTRIWSKE